MSPAATTLPATVLVVDDDYPVLRRVSKELLRRTNLGVLIAEDLQTAAWLLNHGYPIGAVLADLHFRADAQDKERQLNDGLAFLSLVREKHPRLPVYVFSMDVDDKMQRTRAMRMGLRVREWFDKLKALPGQLSPWFQIERDLVTEALKSDPAFREKVLELGENPTELITDEHVAEKVRSVFNSPRLTYLQHLPKGCGYALKEPIEVRCWPDGNEFKATVFRIPLLVEAQGEDPVEVIENLAQMIVDEKVALDAADESRVSGYARYIKEQLTRCLERDPEVGLGETTK